MISQTVSAGRPFWLMCNLLDGKGASFRWNFRPFVNRTQRITHSKIFADASTKLHRSEYEGSDAVRSLSRERKTSRGHNVRYKIESTDHWSMLSIAKATAEDAGTYVCNAFDGGSRDRSSAFIRVQGKSTLLLKCLLKID